MLSEKSASLDELLTSYGSVAIAFSGGIDSALLAYTAHEVLGDRMIALTVNSSLLTQADHQDVDDFCSRYGIPHQFVDVDVFTVPEFAVNPPDRCYHCKKHIFTTLKAAAEAAGMAHLAEGSNVDDEGDYRPGLKAIAELQVESPLRKAGFTKDDIRRLSKELELPLWNKPSAACLASRIPYGDRITPEALQQIEKAEEYMHSMGFNGCRVRKHGNLARIELADMLSNVEGGSLSAFMRDRELIYTHLKEAGFQYVTLDLQGYRTGSLNEVLKS